MDLITTIQGPETQHIDREKGAVVLTRGDDIYSTYEQERTVRTIFGNGRETVLPAHVTLTAREQIVSIVNGVSDGTAISRSTR